MSTTLQTQFIKFIRDPKKETAPAMTTKGGGELYAKLVYSNLSEILAAAFPVFFSIVSSSLWDELITDFIKSGTTYSPLFHYIPRDFYHFMRGRPHEKIPPFTLALLHYEWLELYLDLADIPWPDHSKEMPLHDESQLKLSPLAELQEYPYPVHQISKEFQPSSPSSEPTLLLVHRTRKHEVIFTELGLFAADLLSLVNVRHSVRFKDVFDAFLARSSGIQLSADVLRKKIEEFFLQMVECDAVLSSKPIQYNRKVLKSL